MKPRKNTMRRMMVILMGAILIIVSILQISENSGSLWMNLVFAILGLLEIILSVIVMIIQKKADQKESNL